MHRFTICPTDMSYPSAEIIAIDAGEVLSIVDRLNCHDADVLQDGVYSFSVRQCSSGMWSIHRRFG
jgi:hypothetical protein